LIGEGFLSSGLAMAMKGKLDRATPALLIAEAVRKVRLFIAGPLVGLDSFFILLSPSRALASD
jgi:hypothetical protein